MSERTSSLYPVSNLVSIIPFADLESVRKTIAFTVLATDGSLTYFDYNTLTPDADLKKLTYKASGNDGPSTSPAFVKAAYWDDIIAAVDDQSNICDLKVDWDHDTYTVSQSCYRLLHGFYGERCRPGRPPLRQLSLAALRRPPPSRPGDPTLQWKRWLIADAVTNLGVASPGVLLHINVLTRALRGRYIDVQTSANPTV